MKKLWVALAILVTGQLLSGCGDQPIQGDFVTNQPPITSVTSSPPVLGQTSFTVEFYWAAEDPDSDILGYEWRISDNGVDGVVDEADTLEADLPWRFTTATDSIFVVSAVIDSFGADVSDPLQDPDDYRYWQTHTFFIRAVDEEGLRDPTPAMVSFTATTLAPTVVINLPTLIPSITCISAARVLTFGWSAKDPDNPNGNPAEVRYLLRRTGGFNDICLTRSVFESSTPIAASDPDWSDWIPFDAANDSGKTVTLPKQQVSDKFLFAVQARDLAGAVTPTFVWGRNVRHVQISRDKFPELQVSERFLGGDKFVGTNRVVAREVVQGQTLDFEWSGDASGYAGIIDAFRYGWDLADPDDENDKGWSVAWGKGANWKKAPTRSFLQGAHNFVVQVRDNSGTVSRAIYQLQVIQIADPATQRSVLLIDDWKDTSPQQLALDAAWDLRWNSYLQTVSGFQATDVLEAQSEATRLKFATVNEYRSVIWFTNANKLSVFHNKFAPLGLKTPQFNWLEVYQAKVGNLLLVGPSAAYSSIERDPPVWQFPVAFNVPFAAPLGFGEETSVTGEKFNRGTIRYPYSAWCLETVDVIRPAFTQIFDEKPGRPVRALDCSAIYRARIDSQFLLDYADAEGSGVTDLQPRAERKNIGSNPLYQPANEEFYNRNPTPRNLTLQLRDCQKPMFRAEARVDAMDPEPSDDGSTPGTYVIPVLSVCGELDGKKFDRDTASEGSYASGVTTAPIGVASSVYSLEKQLVGQQDFLWGFNPMSFEDNEVRAAVQWIIRSQWDISVR